MASDLRYLFRFRDLVANTVESHQAVIHEHGASWWGWWKRPSENIRSEVWSALAAASEINPVAIGLFDSGNGHVYRALVTAIIPPNEQGGLVDGPTDKKLIPAYYRGSPFSRAWMRLTKIEKVSDFFGNYSFAKAPVLPKYREALLRRFAGKRIVDKDELTGMDTTIWEIRPSIESDGADEIVLSSQALSAAVTGEVVRLRSNRILHITDLHFATGAFRGQHNWRLESEVEQKANTLATALHAPLKDTPIGGIIVTGDLGFRGDADEFKEARASLNRLLGLLNLEPDQLIVIPGNHDIAWTATEEYAPGAKLEEISPEGRRNYEDFYRALFRHEPSPHLAMGRRWLLPSGLTLEIGALNSTALQTGKKFLAGMGRIDEASLEEVQAGLDWRENQGSHEPTLALRILALHHHLAVTEDIESAEGFAQGYGMAVDAVRIQRRAANFRIQLALHGHKHRAFLWRSSVYDLPEHASPTYKLGEISMVGGGSAGSTETEGDSNYFNILDFTPAGLEVSMYKARAKGSFGFFKMFRAPFGRFEDGGLKLEDWAFVK